MNRITLSHQTVFADLVQKCLDASFDEDFPENGSFTQQTHNGKKYWYYLGYETASGGTSRGRKYSKYVGPADDPEVTKRVEDFTRSKTSYKGRRSLVTSLRGSGLPTPPPLVGDIVEIMWKGGIFRLRGVLIGTLAYQTYAGLLGVRLASAAIMTGDVDFAHSKLLNDTMPPMLETLRSVDKTFRTRPNQIDDRAAVAFVNDSGLSIEFLTPNRGGNDNARRPVKMPALRGASALALRYLDFLIKDPVRSVLLHKGGVLVTVPAPERYAVHKLIVSDLRLKDPNGVAKSRKDAVQAGLLIEALMINAMGTDLGFAWLEAWDRGPQWRKHISAGRQRLTPEQADLLRSAVLAASEEEGRSIGDYGFSDEQEKRKPAPERQSRRQGRRRSKSAG